MCASFIWNVINGHLMSVRTHTPICFEWFVLSFFCLCNGIVLCGFFINSTRKQQVHRLNCQFPQIDFIVSLHSFSYILNHYSIFNSNQFFFEVHAQPNNSHRFANFWSVRDFSLLPKSFRFIDRLFSRKFERNLNKINYFRKIWSINICLFSLSLRSVTIRSMPSEAELMRKWQKNWSENSHVTTTNIWMLLRVLFEIQNVNTYTVVSKCYAIL